MEGRTFGTATKKKKLETTGFHGGSSALLRDCMAVSEVGELVLIKKGILSYFILKSNFIKNVQKMNLGLRTCIAMEVEARMGIKIGAA